MFVAVMYYNETAKAYCGRSYTYYTQLLDLQPLDAVLVPVGERNELKEAVVIDVDIPIETIPTDILPRIKEIKGGDQR